MPNQKLLISLNAENIGPHVDLNKISFSKEVNSNKCINLTKTNIVILELLKYAV